MRGKGWKKFDWIMMITVLFLVGIGLISLYSASLKEGDFIHFKKQLIFLGIGVFLCWIMSLGDYRIFKTNPFFLLAFYFFSLFLLGGLFFFAPEIRGTKSWYKIGPFSFDPIELTKLILIILLAKYFSMRHVEMYRIKHILISGVYILLPILLIFFQPNIGAVIILGAIWLGILVVSGIKLRHFFLLMIIFLLVLSLLWSFFLKDYQKIRIISFLFPQREPLGAGWHQRQAKIATGSGGFWGKGIGKGTQVQYGFLPEVQTDFIFAGIAEELGVLGTGILFLLFSVLLWRILKIAFLAKDNFPRLFSVGFAISLMSQFFVNVGMNIGLLPIIGIPLPFVSYGGSALIMNFVGLGILQSIYRRNR